MNRRPNLVLAVVIGVVAVLTVVAVVVSAGTRTTDLDPSSPEGTVQSYLRAAFDGHYEEAAALLAPDSPCGATDLDQTSVPSSMQVVLVDTQIEADRAWVRVRLVDGGDDPLGAEMGAEEQTFRLVRSADGWRLSGIPWPLFDCRGGAT